MRHSRTIYVPRCRRPLPAHVCAVLAVAFDKHIARRLSDPTRPAPGPGYPTPLPV